METGKVAHTHLNGKGTECHPSSSVLLRMQRRVLAEGEHTAYVHANQSWAVVKAVKTDFIQELL